MVIKVGTTKSKLHGYEEGNSKESYRARWRSSMESLDAFAVVTAVDWGDVTAVDWGVVKAVD